MNKIIFGRRRAVSETIGTMLLLVITVVGAVMISNFLQDGFFQGVDQNPSGVEASPNSIQLTGFDTRDAEDLINVSDLDNEFNQILCAKGDDAKCTMSGTASDIPDVIGGTEFISLQLRNMNTGSIFLKNVQVNNELHEWDSGTAGNELKALNNFDAGTKYPRAGFFSIIPSPDRPNSEKQFASQEVRGNEEVRIIIKLSEDVSDIKMWDSMLIVVNFGSSQPAQFIISTIVGGIIFLVLLTAGFSTFFVAMDVQSDTINAQRSISNSIIEKTQEQFSIAVATDDSNGYKLGIQVKNEGPNPIQISNFWIINKSLPNQPVYNIPVYYNDAFITPGSNSSILETQHLTMVQNDYDIKVISTLGTIQKTELKVGGNNYLLAEMFTIPPDVRQGENATIALRVTNIGPTMISAITPDDLLFDDSLYLPPPHAEVNNLEPVSMGPVDLNPSESTIFSWHMTLKPAATVGTKVKFSNFANGYESVTGFGVTSNTASDKIIVRDPQGGSGETIVLTEDLLSRPEIFAVYPSPFGDSVTDKGIWGLNIVNPTNAIMKISKVTLSAFAPGAQNNDKIFQIGGIGCGAETISPVPAVPHVPGWSCISENQLLWKDLDNPQILPPYSTQSFLVKVRPGSAAGSNNLESIIIHGNVFTTFGSFGKTDYATTMVDGSEAVVNVYSSLTDTPALLRDNAQINGTISQIVSGSTKTFNIVLADMDSDDAEYIKSGAKLIVNVPKHWENVAIDTVNSDGFVMAPLPIVDVHADTSTQIIATSSQKIGDAGRKAAVLVFTADAPTVSKDQMYIMYVLADGTTDNNWAVGPLAEIVLHVPKP